MLGGKKGTAPGDFNLPIGLAVDGADSIYVIEFHNNRVQKFSAEGKLQLVFAVGQTPGGIAVDRHGYVHVAQMMEHCTHPRAAPVV
jgi:DNA-binding beta-propeller fold protein YncE